MAHQHRTYSTGRTRCYTGPTDAYRPDRRAHGNVEFTEHCRCGAERRVLVNQCFVETGRWHAPEKEDDR